MGPRYAALTSTIPVEPFSPPFHFTLHVFSLECLPLIEKLLSLCESQIHLHFPIQKIKLDWNQRIASLLDLADQTFDLSFVKEKFSRPQRIMVEPVCLRIWTDMSIDEEDLAVFHVTVTVSQVHLSLSQGLDFRPK